MSRSVRLRLFIFIFIVAICSFVYFVSKYSFLDDSEKLTIIESADDREEALEDIEEQLDERNQGSLIGIVGSLAAGLLSVWGVVDTFWREVGGMRKLQIAKQELENEKLKLEIQKLKSELKTTRSSDST